MDRGGVYSEENAVLICVPWLRGGGCGEGRLDFSAETAAPKTKTHISDRKWMDDKHNVSTQIPLPTVTNSGGGVMIFFCCHMDFGTLR